MIDPNLREKPYFTIQRAIELFAKIEGKIIVEIGCMRIPMNHPLSQHDLPCCVDGHSTLHWAPTKAEVYSVDVSTDAVNTVCEEIVKRKIENVIVVQDDGINFLHTFPKTIDLLFLDGWDVGLRDYDLRHLEAYIIARDKMSERSMILIDDTDVFWDWDRDDIFMAEDGRSGKGRLLIPRAIKDGYKLECCGRQTLLTRNCSQ